MAAFFSNCCRKTELWCGLLYYLVGWHRAGRRESTLSKCVMRGHQRASQPTVPLQRECDYIFGMTRQHVDAVAVCRKRLTNVLDKRATFPIQSAETSKCISGVTDNKALRKRLGEIWDEIAVANDHRGRAQYR